MNPLRKHWCVIDEYLMLMICFDSKFISKSDIHKSLIYVVILQILSIH